MRIYELRPNSDPAKLEQIKERLVHAGLSYVDEGQHAMVFRNKSDEIVRIFEADKGYQRFIELVRLHPTNPHFPKIRKFAAFTQQPYLGLHMIKVEPLSPIPTNAWYKNIGLHCFLHSVFHIAAPLKVRQQISNGRVQHFENACLKQAQAWQEHGPEFAKAVSLVVENCPKFCTLDLHRGNLMLRGRTWVITDPYD